MRCFSLCLLAVLIPPAFAQQTLPADAIMARVAANQDRSVQLRKEYIYEQHIHVASRETNGRLMREVASDYEVVPSPDGVQKTLLRQSGRYYQKGKYIEFSKKSADDDSIDSDADDDSIDSDLTDDFRDDLTDEKTKDGLARNLFPLTSDRQKEYAFRLLGETEQDGRPVYRIGFTPRDRHDVGWAGEALIDKQEFQPVYVFTKLNRKLPLLVRGALGTNLPGIGFSVHYRRQPDGVWFPVSFGTEFRLKVLFFLKRNIAVSLENKNFQHTHVDSKVTVLDQKPH